MRAIREIQRRRCDDLICGNLKVMSGWAGEILVDAENRGDLLIGILLFGGMENSHDARRVVPGIMAILYQCRIVPSNMTGTLFFLTYSTEYVERAYVYFANAGAQLRSRIPSFCISPDKS